MEISWNWLGIAVLVLIAAACVSGFRKGFVKEIVSIFFMLLSFLLVWLINPYVNTFIREYTPVYKVVEENFQDLVEKQIGDKKSIGKDEQEQLMENLNLPDILKNKLIENNTVETYQYLAVQTFADYVSDSLAVMVINGVSFLISYILSVIVIRLLGIILDILSKLPVINGINKIAGGVVGGAKCVIFIWIALLVLTLLCNTEVGKAGMDLVQKDTVLNWLYEQDVFVKVFMSVFY